MKVISLINMKGGVGKTTLAVNIAASLAQRQRQRVLLIDVDPQFNATQCLMDPDGYMKHIDSGGHTILNVFDRTTRPVAGAVRGEAQEEPVGLSNIEPVSVGNNLSLLPGNLELYRLEMAPGSGSEQKLRNYLDRHRDNYDYVIIDTPPTPSVWMTSALIASDYYLIPVKPDPISITGIDLLRSIIEERKDNFNLKISCAGLALTMVEENTLVYQQAKKYLSGSSTWSRFLYDSSIPKRTAVARQQLEQQSILDSGDSETKYALGSLVGELLRRI